MRLFLVLVLTLAGCGNDDSDGSSSSPTVEVSSIAVTPAGCTTGIGAACLIVINATLSTGTEEPPAGYDVVIKANQGPVPAAACDATSINIGPVSKFTLPGIPTSSTYSFRACIFNKAAGTYSAGAATIVTTPTML